MSTNGLSAVALAAALKHRHCEQSEAIQTDEFLILDCFALLAMTWRAGVLTTAKPHSNLSIQA